MRFIFFSCVLLLIGCTHSPRWNDISQSSFDVFEISGYSLLLEHSREMGEYGEEITYLVQDTSNKTRYFLGTLAYWENRISIVRMEGYIAKESCLKDKSNCK